MAKLFVRVQDEKLIEVHKIANKYLRLMFYYGSRDNSKLLMTLIVQDATPRPKVSINGLNVDIDSL